VASPRAELSFRFPEGRHGSGELRYSGGVPVLRVAGTPEEIGEQAAALSVRPAPRLLDYPADLLAFALSSKLLARVAMPLARRLGRRLLRQFPEAPRRELDGMVRAGIDRDLVVAANTLFDLKNVSPRQFLFGFGCSSLVVPAGQSTTGQALLGRNLDFFPLGYLHRYSLVTVYPATGGSRAFALVGFPGQVGCSSGMNDAGLSLASHEALEPPGPRRFNPRGVPFALAYRRVLEECSTPAEAFRLLRGIERATSTMAVLCDRNGGMILGVTPDTVEAQPLEAGTLACTNHFLTPTLASRRPPRGFRTVERLETLRGVGQAGVPLGLGDVHSALDAVHQGEMTLQTMVFEPARLRVHLGFGVGPSTATELTALELGPLFA
jgi:isopenicillin-N N-acyltransferase like protein